MDRNCAVLLCLLLLPSVGFAQVTAECPTADCLAAPQTRSAVHAKLWADAGAAHSLKLAFVDAVQRFLRAQAGTFGDEGDDLRRAVDAMAQSLSRWDAAVEQFQTTARRARVDAEVHVALATVLLDRHLVERAIRELELAERQDAGRVDVYTLRALAFGLTGAPAEASRALQRALAIDPDNPTIAYRLAQSLAQAGQGKEAQRILQIFRRAVSAQSGLAARRTAIAPFERVDLLRQPSGVAPIFPQARYADGFTALRAGDYQTAVAKWSTAASGDPLVTGDEIIRTQVIRAAALLKDGQLNAALQQLQTAIAAAPGHAEAHRLLGLLYSIDGQQGRSIEHLRSAIRFAPADERARLALADILAEDRRFSEAERELTLAKVAGISSGLVGYRLARVYERQSLLPSATGAFQDSERFGPVTGRDAFYQALGSLLVNQADFEGAVAAYARRIDVNPNSGEAHRQLAEIYFIQGRHEEALAEFVAAAWLDPGDARAHAGAGQAFVRLLDYVSAVGAFERALALEPGLREARYGLGTSLMRLGKAGEAQKALDLFQQQQAEAEALGQREFRLDALRRQASKELLSGGVDRALALLQEALGLDPRSARLHRDLGLALVKASRPGEAISHLEEGQRLESTAEGFAYLADAYQSAGDTTAAAEQRARYRAAIQQSKLDRIQELAR